MFIRVIPRLSLFSCHPRSLAPRSSGRYTGPHIGELMAPLRTRYRLLFQRCTILLPMRQRALRTKVPGQGRRPHTNTQRTGKFTCMPQWCGRQQTSYRRCISSTSSRSLRVVRSWSGHSIRPSTSSQQGRRCKLVSLAE